MKKISALLLVITLFAAVACKDKKTTETKDGETEKVVDPLAEHDLKVYKRSLERGDAYTAISSLSSFLMRDSSKIEYKDTLLQMYLQTEQAVPTYKLSGELLKVRPNDTLLLQINVSMAYQLGVADLAFDNLKKLLDFEPNNLQLKFQYGQSLLQRNQVDEGIRTLQSIIDDPNSSKAKVPYTVFENGRQVQKELKIKVACLMLMGQLNVELKDYDTAESYFRQSLKVDPTFKAAAEAILDLKQMRNGAK